jgi:hypothetical protein
LDTETGQPSTTTANNDPKHVSQWLAEGAADAAAYPNLAKNGIVSVIDTDLCWSSEVDAAAHGARF